MAVSPSEPPASLLPAEIEHVRADVARVRARVEAVEDWLGRPPVAVETGSRIPGGSTVHRGIARATSRQQAELHGEIAELGIRLVEAVDGIVGAFEDGVTRLLGDLVDLSSGQERTLRRLTLADLRSSDRLQLLEDGQSSLVDRVDEQAERHATLERQVASLRHQLDEVQRLIPHARLELPYSSAAFNAAFRGSRDALIDRYQATADRFVDQGPVLDVGCGSGEFLVLLRDRGVEARGIDLDAAMVAEAQRDDLDAQVGEALEVLTATAPGSLGGVVLIQVIEHLVAHERFELLRLAHRALRPGGLLLIETVNPTSLYAMAHVFWLDPTHREPMHPALLEFLARTTGFREVEIDWRSPPDARHVPEADDEDATRIRDLVFGPMDYALIARK